MPFHAPRKAAERICELPFPILRAARFRKSERIVQEVHKRNPNRALSAHLMQRNLHACCVRRQKRAACAALSGVAAFAPQSYAALVASKAGSQPLPANVASAASAMACF